MKLIGHGVYFSVLPFFHLAHCRVGASGAGEPHNSTCGAATLPCGESFVSSSSFPPSSLCRSWELRTTPKRMSLWHWDLLLKAWVCDTKEPFQQLFFFLLFFFLFYVPILLFFFFGCCLGFFLISISIAAIVLWITFWSNSIYRSLFISLDSSSHWTTLCQ